MKVKLDQGAYKPTRAHPTDAGLDLYARESQVVPAQESAIFKTGVHIQLPKGTCGILISKSGLLCKHGITSTGLIDEGYTGEIVVKLINNSGYDYFVNGGDKISQLVVVPCFYVDVMLVDELDKYDGRNEAGFGSTGR